MKKLTILSAIALSGLIFSTADAQVRFHVGVNLGPVRVVYTQRPAVVEQPVYDEPAQAYYNNNDDDYYYLPDVGAYYDVTAGCYYYNNGYNWVSAAYLPGEYRNYDWRRARRYEIRERSPFMHNDIYRSRYNGHDVAEWRNRRDDNQYGNRSSGYNRPESNRGNDERYGNRGNGAYGQPSNHGSDSYGQRNQNNGGYDHRQNGYGQPSQNNDGNSRGQGGYNQPGQNNGGYSRGQGGQSQPGQNNGGYNHGQGGQSQPGQNKGGNGHGGQGQPTQNGGGGTGNNDHFARNSQNMGMSHRMSRF